MKKLTLVIALVLVAIIAATVYFGRIGKKETTVAFIVPTLNIPFFTDMVAGAQSEAAVRNLQILVQAPTEFTNVEQQVAMIDASVAKRVAAIALVAADSKGVVPALKRAQDAGIPVILVDNSVDEDLAARLGFKASAQIGSDNFLGGKLAAEFLGRVLVGENEVAMLEGVLGSDVANLRKAGFLEGLKSTPRLKLVASQTANYDRAQALDVFANILTAKPNISGLFAANDEMALGALEAVEKTRNKIIIVGFDATDDALKAIASGAMAATVQQQPKEMGRLAIFSVGTLLAGGEISERIEVPVKLIEGTEDGTGN